MISSEPAGRHGEQPVTHPYACQRRGILSIVTIRVSILSGFSSFFLLLPAAYPEMATFVKDFPSRQRVRSNRDSEALRVMRQENVNPPSLSLTSLSKSVSNQPVTF